MKHATLHLAQKIAAAAFVRQARDIVILKVKALVDYTDYLVICSGRSDRQVGAIAEAIETALLLDGHRALGVEGRQTRRWVLLDYDDVVAHVFHEQTRDVYDLERLWFDAPRTEIEQEAVGGAKPLALAETRSR